MNEPIKLEPGVVVSIEGYKLEVDEVKLIRTSGGIKASVTFCEPITETLQGLGWNPETLDSLRFK